MKVTKKMLTPLESSRRYLVLTLEVLMTLMRDVLTVVVVLFLPIISSLYRH